MMNRLNKTAIFSLLAGCLVTTQATTGDETGWITTFDGKPVHYTLTRGQKTVPVAPLTTLLVGDKIVVNNKQHRMELMLQGGAQHVIVTVSNSPFVITEAGKVPSAWSEFWKSVKGFMTYWYQPPPKDVPPVPTGLVKGHEEQSPMIPLLNSATRLIAGERSLLLQWQNGKPPFTVQVTHTPLWQDTTILWEGTAEKNSWITTKPINFEHRKNYRVIVTDANGRDITRGFRAVASDKIAGFPPQERLTWLLQQSDKNKWGFEILQRLTQRR